MPLPVIFMQELIIRPDSQTNKVRIVTLNLVPHFPIGQLVFFVRELFIVMVDGSIPLLFPVLVDEKTLLYQRLLLLLPMVYPT